LNCWYDFNVEAGVKEEVEDSDVDEELCPHRANSGYHT